MKFCPNCRALFMNDGRFCMLCRMPLERIKLPSVMQAEEKELEK